MIRLVAKEDLARISEIIVFGKRTAYRKIFNNDNCSFNELQVVNTFNLFLNQPDLWMNMMVYDDGIIKGVINYINVKNTTTCELVDFYVDPFFIGNGIGRTLLNTFICKMKDKKMTQIVLWVLNDNIIAKRLYENSDFVKTGNKRFIEGTKVLDVEYIKYL